MFPRAEKMIFVLCLLLSSFAVTRTCSELKDKANCGGDSKEGVKCSSPAARSWVSYRSGHPFPLQNLPYGVYRRRRHNNSKNTEASSTDNDDEQQHICTAIGDYICDLSVLATQLPELFEPSVVTALQQPVLNDYMSLGHVLWSSTRNTLTNLFQEHNSTLRDNESLRRKVLIRKKEVMMVLPAKIGDYTDFYASKEHASNLGKMFRPNQPPLLENWRHIPIGYHGRSSSIVISGTPIRRPNGQTRPVPDAPPVFGPSKAVDFELEVAAWIGPGNNLGEPISVHEAKQKHIFGYSLFNDWSARDIQKWEYVPLGPFLGKNFGCVLGEWIVAAEALEPFLMHGPTPEVPQLPYLQSREPGHYNVHLSISLEPKQKNINQGEKEEGDKKTSSSKKTVISETNFKYTYWSPSQMIAHHTSNGCNLQTGDLLASGTISGPEEGSFGSMIELAWQGTKPVMLDGRKGKHFQRHDDADEEKEKNNQEKNDVVEDQKEEVEVRRMVEDYDTVYMEAVCQGDGYVIGFGECSSQLLPAVEYKL